MSRFIDMLHNVGERGPATMGFGAGSRRDAVPPQMVLAARVLGQDLAADPGLADTEADSLLLGTDYPLSDAAVAALKGKVWGVRLVRFSSDQAKELMDKGCDFIVFESMETEAGVLNEEELGTIATVSTDLGEEVVLTTAGLPLDGVLLSPAQRTQPLTVGDLVEIQRVGRLVDKPFIVESPLGLAQADVEALRNLGVAGLIVDVHPLDKVAEMRRLIAELPSLAKRRSHSDALVPGAVGEAGYDDESDDS